MEISGIAFDCCWLKDLDGKDFDEQYAAMKLVERMVLSGVGMLLDHEGHIDREYYRNISARSAGGRIVEKLKKSSNFNYVSGKPTAACFAALQADAFDPSDVPYIGAAQNGKGVLVTSEEKHLVDGRVDLVASRCNVMIIGSMNIATLLT
ncbi:hypothetical protein [Mycolicibacterium sp. OfavD-34-C]|uniref:hypothetical protein n=1 Tax=Mycolicibacterium sp. OfavD-34-C TaxID=2917746 RepID=UPI001EF4AFD1|nr:hypothetical protein [Mycolicibacterium sp. OfavD-34-C]MCG7581422.1 hypothetical protein [Mycolicibacterium sp. OfavD-34-C]